MTQRKIDDLFNQKRSTHNRDEFDDLFEKSKKRQRTTKIDDIFQTTNSLKKKRSQQFDDEQTKKFRNSQESTDLLNMFNKRSNQISTIDHDFKVPSKVKMFFDDSDLNSSREENEIKDYTQIKPVVITGGQWLSKEGEIKSICEPSTIPDDERNLMLIQFVPLTLDDKPQKRTAASQLGKSFRKQLVVSDSNIVRKENLQSCYNSLLEDVNKSRLNSPSKIQDDIEPVDFFDLPSRRKKS